MAVEEALSKYMEALRAEGIIEKLRSRRETISTYDTLGRVTSEAVYAKCCSPLFNAAAMDGIAVKSVDTRNASERKP